MTKIGNEYFEEGICPVCGNLTIDGWTTEETDYAYDKCPECGSSLMDDDEE